jgi:hypothetical protein
MKYPFQRSSGGRQTKKGSPPEGSRPESPRQIRSGLTWINSGQTPGRIQSTAPPATVPPTGPRCGQLMVLRVVHKEDPRKLYAECLKAADEAYTER